MASEEQEIRKIVEEIVAAWNSSDSVRFAAPFAEDAIFIHIYGGQLDGRAAIEASHRLILDTIYKGSYNEMKLQSVRFVRPDVAIAHLVAHLKFFEGGETREMQTRPTIVVARENGKWQIVALQNTRVSELPGAIKNSPVYKR